ncbi:MAG: 3H domain-containing protein [Oscillospiraceae bacterium]
MFWSLERFEGDFALCEDAEGGHMRLPRAQLPTDVREGEILVWNQKEWTVDHAETDRRRKAHQSRLARMAAASRRREIEALLITGTDPISASVLAERFSVSRQVIVGDVALMRASGAPVVATPRGYLLRRAVVQGVTAVIACRHTASQILEELYAVVDEGGAVLDVVVEHPVYGQLSGELQIFSRHDADRFATALTSAAAPPLSVLTDGIHLHTLRCPDEACLARIRESLRRKGVLLEEE